MSGGGGFTSIGDELPGTVNKTARNQVAPAPAMDPPVLGSSLSYDVSRGNGSAWAVGRPRAHSYGETEDHLDQGRPRNNSSGDSRGRFPLQNGRTTSSGKLGHVPDASGGVGPRRVIAMRQPMLHSDTHRRRSKSKKKKRRSQSRQFSSALHRSATEHLLDANATRVQRGRGAAGPKKRLPDRAESGGSTLRKLRSMPSLSHLLAPHSAALHSGGVRVPSVDEEPSQSVDRTSSSSALALGTAAGAVPLTSMSHDSKIEEEPKSKEDLHAEAQAKTSEYRAQLKAKKHRLDTIEYRLNEEHVEKGEEWLVDHDSYFKGIVDDIVAFLILYTIIIIPLELAFDPLPADASLIIDVFVTLGFTLSIVIHFRTKVELTERIITDPKEIGLRYLRGWFVLDLAATIPWDLILRPVVGSSGDGLQIARLLRVARLLRLVSGDSFSVHYSQMSVRFFRLLVYGLGLAHWMGCAWWILSKYEDHPPDGFAAPASLLDRTPTYQYFTALHWGCWSIISMGSELDPSTSLELALSIGVIVIGVATFATIIGNIEVLLAQSAAHSIRFSAQLQALEDFFDHHNIPDRLKERILYHTHHNYRTQRGQNVRELLSTVPAELRNKTLRRLYYAKLASTPMLEGCHESFVDALCVYVRPEVAAFGDVIIRQGSMTLADEAAMYIITRGRAEVVNLLTGEHICVLGEGEVFGEIAVVMETIRTATVRALTYMELLVIPKQQMRMLLRIFPEEYESFVAKAEERLLRGVRGPDARQRLRRAIDRNMKMTGDQPAAGLEFSRDDYISQLYGNHLGSQMNLHKTQSLVSVSEARRMKHSAPSDSDSSSSSYGMPERAITADSYKLQKRLKKERRRSIDRGTRAGGLFPSGAPPSLSGHNSEQADATPQLVSPPVLSDHSRTRTNGKKKPPPLTPPARLGLQRSSSVDAPVAVSRASADSDEQPGRDESASASAAGAAAGVVAVSSSAVDVKHPHKDKDAGAGNRRAVTPVGRLPPIQPRSPAARVGSVEHALHVEVERVFADMELAWALRKEELKKSILDTFRQSANADAKDDISD